MRKGSPMPPSWRAPAAALVLSAAVHAAALLAEAATLRDSTAAAAP